MNSNSYLTESDGYVSTKLLSLIALRLCMMLEWLLFTVFNVYTILDLDTVVDAFQATYYLVYMTTN